jgi:hypothetical protein
MFSIGEFSKEFEYSIRCFNFIDHHFFKKCFKVYRYERSANKPDQMRIFLKLFIVSIPMVMLMTGCRHPEKTTDKVTYEEMSKNFLNPSGPARPKVYWWCLNGNIDTAATGEEFRAMKKAGIAGFDLFEIGSGDKMVQAGPAFLSDESVKTIKFVVNEAGKVGLTVGLNLASSWNAGGSWIEAQHGGKSLYCSVIKVTGDSSIQKIKIPFPEINFPRSALIGGTGKSLIPFRADGRPEYYEEIAVLAIPVGIENNALDTSGIFEVSRYFDPQNDELKWEVPAGEWIINRYICSNSGQHLVLPSPYSAGLTIDHFDSTAVRVHLMYIINRLRPVLGDFRNTALKSFYLASYEARGFVWSSTLPREFKKLHGYDVRKYLPLFFSDTLFSRETARKVQADFRKTLSEMMITNLYKKAKSICNSYGLKINCEAGGPGYPLYNGPAEPLKALGALDLPRGEFWVNHSRYYKDTDGKDSIDILRVVKEVAAASHIYERRIVEEEAFTSFQHWMEGPFDLKPIGDRAFCEGMNRVVFHGFTHNPAGTGYPGIVYHAGTHMNTKRIWWPQVNAFIDYLSRLSYIFQEADFFSDVLYYYGDRIPNSVTPKNTHFKVGPGYDYEVINTEILLDKLTVKDGKLVLPNGAVFSILALEDEEIINPDVLNRLGELARQSVVIVGKKPVKVADVIGSPYSGVTGTKLINKLWTDIDKISDLKARREGRIYSGITPLEMLTILDIPSDLDYNDKESFLLDYIHYQKNDIDFYFIRNTIDQWISRECGFRQRKKVPEIWDPMTGKIIPVKVYHEDGKYIRLPVTLAPFGSSLIVFKKGAATTHYTDVSPSGKNPPLMVFTADGIHFLEEGNYKLDSPSGSRQIENHIDVIKINGPWAVHFTRGWGAPDSVLLPELISWTDHINPGIKYYSGTGNYRKVFCFEISHALSEEEKIFIDIGELSEVAELYLNGQPLGITWAKPHRFDITGFIKNGENLMEIKVANTWCNRIIGDAITGEKYTSTNITRVDLLTWDQVPLNPSGLLGPVTVQRVKLVK